MGGMCPVFTSILEAPYLIVFAATKGLEMEKVCIAIP